MKNTETSLIENIKRHYQKTYKFFFKKLIFLIIILISLLVVSKNIIKNTTLDINDTFMIEKVKLKGEFNKRLNENIHNKDIYIYITNGILESNDELLLSVDNLISYKGLIMPKNIFLYNLSTIKSKEYFSQDNYKIEELENFINNTVFTNSEQIEKSLKNTISLPINETIEKTFYTNCINKTKIFTKTCNYFISNFIDNFYIYNISKDYEGLKKIFEKLKNTKHKENFCENINKYILYSNDTNKELENIFLKCGSKYYQNFKKLNIFLNIQDQLNKGYINQDIYESEILNDYKLLSYQQIIHNDLKNNTINNIRFESYINYLKSILKKTGTIDNLFIDTTYRFNNNYTIKTLNKIKYKLTENKRLEIDNIIKKINKINNGDSLEGYKGLKELIRNKNLISFNKENNDLNNKTKDNTYKLLEEIKSLSFLKIINDKISEDKIKISGYFSIKLNEGYLPLYFGLILRDTNNKAVIENININEYNDLNSTISNIIKQKDYTITEIYQYIQNNINIFLSKDRISTCDIIFNKVHKIQENNRNINYIDLMECNGENINLLKEEKIKESNIKTYYKITIENFNITNINISDKELENEIKEYIKDINTNHITIPNIIGEILLQEKTERSITQQGSNGIIITIQDLETYLGAKPKDIAESNGIILAEFYINGINFVGNYNIESNKLGPLYFKYNKQNDEDNENKVKREDLIINKFEIYLKEENQNEINKFLIDPISYIKDIDPISVINYEKLKYK